MFLVFPQFMLLSKPFYFPPFFTTHYNRYHFKILVILIVCIKACGFYTFVLIVTEIGTLYAPFVFCINCTIVIDKGSVLVTLK